VACFLVAEGPEQSLRLHGWFGRHGLFLFLEGSEAGATASLLAEHLQVFVTLTMAIVSTVVFFGGFDVAFRGGRSLADII